jgi:hypothetical protein
MFPFHHVLRWTVAGRFVLAAAVVVIVARGDRLIVAIVINAGQRRRGIVARMVVVRQRVALVRFSGNLALLLMTVPARMIRDGMDQPLDHTAGRNDADHHPEQLIPNNAAAKEGRPFLNTNLDGAPSGRDYLFDGGRNKIPMTDTMIHNGTSDTIHLLVAAILLRHHCTTTTLSSSSLSCRYMRKASFQFLFWNPAVELFGRLTIIVVIGNDVEQELERGGKRRWRRLCPC